VTDQQPEREERLRPSGKVEPGCQLRPKANLERELMAAPAAQILMVV
jgi:hypothetical protein